LSGFQSNLRESLHVGAGEMDIKNFFLALDLKEERFSVPPRLSSNRPSDCSHQLPTSSGLIQIPIFHLDRTLLRAKFLSKLIKENQRKVSHLITDLSLSFSLSLSLSPSMSLSERPERGSSSRHGDTAEYQQIE
jgi:hypothetical protein